MDRDHVTYKTIVGIDYDYTVRSELEKAMFLLRLKQICQTHTCRIKQTRKGIHVYIYFDRKLSYWEKRAVRVYLFDDIIRVFYDDQRYYKKLYGTVDTLFNVKFDPFTKKVLYEEREVSIDELEKILFSDTV